MNKIVTPIALGFLFFLLGITTSQNSESDSLRIVHIIFRHGQRTPVDTYPLDPLIQQSFEPYGWGQLTNTGKLDQFHQGEWLRARYANFLDDRYSADTFKVQCTDVDRAKMSTQLMLAGLYPPKGDQVWNPNLMWQPIPISSEPLKYDTLLLGRYPCPRYQEELDKVFRSSEVKSILETNQYLFQYLSTQSGLSIRTPDDAQSLYSTLKAEQDFGLELPEWTRKVFPDPLAKITAQSFVFNAMNNVLQKLKGGFLLKKIMDDTKAKLRGNSKMKMFAYGGHDSTVSNFLLTLDAWDLQVPEYNSLVIVEVHQMDPETHGVKLFLRNSTTAEPYLLQMPGCGPICPWENFICLTQSKLPSRSYKEECQSENPNYVYTPSTSAP